MDIVNINMIAEGSVGRLLSHTYIYLGLCKVVDQ